jgi:hypothetical protein
VFTARYALSPYIKQIRFVFKGLMLYREIIAVCSETHTKHINTLCGQNVECSSTQSYKNAYHCALKRQQTSLFITGGNKLTQLSKVGDLGVLH